ncbi:DNA polymerase III, delta subunit [Desulfuromusa kysingii]|uniref:DNA polymerase III subunit delta n=1 Tax=Desulfuromusa kysingii TaxID=37625 RepID=A0A1H4BI28_9BACT|nr:DNA polymerase III subunit delta [Desulfuromusa kysingii]SEA47694.1 DNA polymerase III, delta subunit [Desulfuromusa kysingii]
MNAAELFQRLRSGQVPSVIFLCGQEPYLIQKAARAVRQVVLPAGHDDFNDNQFYAKEVKADEILAAAMTLPVFADKRLVSVKDAHQLPAAELEKLLPYILDPVPETCLLFIAGKVDNRRKFFQKLKKNNSLVEFKPLTERELPQYVRHTLNQRDIKISADAVELFCSMVGVNLHEIHAELDKLINYIGTATLIDVIDVQAVVSRGRAENVFDIGDAVGSGDIGKALTLVMRLNDAGEAPLKILSLLVMHFRRLWKVRELQVQKYPTKDIASLAGVPPFVVTGLIQQGKKFSRNDFIRAYELFLQADLAMKSSGANSRALLESLILALVKTKSQ